MDDDRRTKRIITELIELMNQNDLAELEIEEEGCRIRLRKAESKVERPVVYSAGAAPMTAQATAEHVAAAAAQHREAAMTVKSPMVGTFYRAPSPDSDPFVEAGDNIAEESVICIIEAMKVMNEIKAECRGTIKDILVANGEPVEYGQPLFLVEPAP